MVNHGKSDFGLNETGDHTGANNKSAVGTADCEPATSMGPPNHIH